MKYPFPYIRHIDEVKEAVSGRKEFIITEKPQSFTVVNYLVNMEDTFPDVNLTKTHFGYEYASKQDKLNAIKRECRGIKFDSKTGLVIARPYNKFFNFGEKQETQNINLDLQSDEQVILEKFDGSMIHPMRIDGQICWSSKMGITDITKPIDEFVKSHPEYIKLANYAIDNNYTVIFEWCSRKQQIILDYPEDMLVLTAIRENYNGRYSRLKEIYELLDELQIKIPVVKHLATKMNFNEWILKARNETGNEGYVVRFNNGHMLKIKNEDYLRMHKNKDGLQQEKNVIDLIINEKMDDVKPFLTKDDLHRINEFEREFWQGFNWACQDLNAKFIIGKIKVKDDRKRFALEFVTEQDPLYKSVYFQMWGGDPIRNIMTNFIKNNIKTQTEVDRIRKVFNANWTKNKEE